MSTHHVDIVEIEKVLPHPNADRLEIVPVGEWQAVVKKGDFKPGDLAVYIEPDYTVPTTRPEFAFLAREGQDRHRLKAVRLRGELSFGLLIPVPPDLSWAKAGYNAIDALDIVRYEPAMKLASSDELAHAEWPTTFAPRFDVENFKSHRSLIEPGEPVIITEKIHGANARYLFQDGTFYIGSRTRWLRPSVDHAWKVAADGDRRILAWCERNPGTVLYGEVFGPVQSLRYGSAKPRFVAFAACAAGAWIDTGRLLDDAALPTVPVLYRGPFDQSVMAGLAEGDSSINSAPAGHMREGVVIVPEHERRDANIGRVALKYISNRYWTSND